MDDVTLLFLGTFVSRVMATDIDAGLNARVDYLFVEGSRDDFVVDVDNGEVTVSPNSDLDFETKREYTIIVS